MSRGVVAACLVLVSVSRVSAQQPLEQAPAAPQFMSRYDFHLSAAGLASNDDRFSFDTHWGGEFDLVDYVAGRLTFLIDYQAMLGREFRPFDPIQGNYTLAVSGSVRARGTELAGVFHHVSRHLSDRPKPHSIAINALLGRVLHRFSFEQGSIDVRAEGGPVLARAFLDYTWLGTAEIVARRRLHSALGLYARAVGEAYGVDPTIAERGGQQGGRLEGGVRLSGRGGAVELFAGYERVVDAYQLERRPRRWAFAGFRLVN